MWDHVNICKNEYAATIWAIPKQHATACLGLSSMLKRSQREPKQWRESVSSKLDVAEMSSTMCNSSAVAAATGRGFKSRPTDFNFCQHAL
jgi:hypothetical protein